MKSGFKFDIIIILKMKGAIYEKLIKFNRGGGTRLNAPVNVFDVLNFNIGKRIVCIKGFTLAEVLVTLGIIGVVSAMTVPSLMQNYQKKSYVAQIHKFYNELQQAAQQYMTEHNAVNLREAGLTSNAALNDFVKSNFKVINDCGSTNTPCMALQYRKLSGTNIGKGSGQGMFVTIASGVSFGYGIISSGSADNSRLAIFDVDINGQKGPNIAGRDVFILGLFNNGLVDEYAVTSAPADKDTREKLFNDTCNSSGNTTWHGCFGKLLNDNFEMNY